MAAGVPAAVRQIAVNLDDAVKVMSGGAKLGSFGKGVTLLGKVAGPLAMVTGGFSFVSGIQAIQEGNETGDTKKQAVGWLDTISGTTAILGGVTLLIPGAQPVAAALLGFSALTSVASLAVENWDSIKNFLTRPEGPYPGIRTTSPTFGNNTLPHSPASTATPPFVVNPSAPTSILTTPTPPPTSTPTLTPTLPATNTPTSTPQTTQTPEPLETPKP